MQPNDQWAQLFDKPNPGAIHELSSQNFTAFIAYVFGRAGYEVVPHSGAGASLELKFGGVTQAFVATSAGVEHVGAHNVLAFNGMPGKFDAKLYYVSSGDFAGPAISAAKEMENLLLINSATLDRYINYVRGTRHPKARGVPISPTQLFGREPTKRPLSQTKVIVLANNKGGVCKTTSSLAIALILATEKHKKVLLVDVDDQANLTQAAFGKVRFETPNISDYFVQAAPLGQLIQSTRFANLWIIPSHPDLRLTFSLNVDWTQTEKEFIYALHHETIRPPGAIGDFDWIIIDTPPSLSLYTRAALLAAHRVLVPFTPSVLDQIGLQNVIETLNDVSGIASAGHQTSLLGCFATRWKRTAAAKEDYERMRAVIQQKQINLLEAEIAEDANNTRKLILYEPSTNISRIHGAIDDYRELVREVQNHVGDQ